MSMFSTLLHKILGGGAPAARAQPAQAAPAAQAAPQPPGAPAQAAAPAPLATAAAQAAPAPAQQVDVTQVLDGLAAKNGQGLDWKHSIVDMLKLLDMDSSLGARKTLAAELGYPGDDNDSAAMNLWLHKAVIQKVAENGGKAPMELMG
jgi:hypothetical protein